MTLAAKKRLVARVLCGALLSCAAGAARAQDEAVLGRAMDDYNGGRMAQAAQGFFQVEEGARAGPQRFQAQYYLAQSLGRLGFSFGSFFYYAALIEAGSAHPYFLKAVEGAAAVAAQYRDEVLAPNLFSKAYGENFRALPPEVLAKVDYAVALLRYRAGSYEEAEQFLRRVPAASAVYPQARYLAGLLLQRKDPEQAAQAFRGVIALAGSGGLEELKELAWLGLGRTLYGMRRHAEASHAYAALPRFSRHWDEALFEGAYADLQGDDPGAALGKLHGLHSPHLSDEFAPESLNLTAIVYHRRCLYPQVREVIADFDRTYLPMKEKVKAIVDSNLPVEAYPQLLQQGDARLPSPVQHHLQKNERVEAMLGYLGRLEAEAARVRRDPQFAVSPLGADLLDLISKQAALSGQVAGKFIKGRLADLAHLIEVLDADKEIIGFETAKGEKEMLETGFDARGQLRSQALDRPPMPASGYEYWPFDGEYWPDEIGYYRYTLKDACPPRKEE